MASQTDAAVALANIMASGNDLEQCLAAQSLSRIGDTSVADVLIAALRNPDEDVRIDAASAIVALSIEEAVPTIIENIAQDPSIDAKIANIKAVGDFRAKAAIPVLRKLVGGMAEDEIAWDEEDISQSETDEWLEVQLAVIEALAQIGATDAVEDIVSAMDDEFGQDLVRPGLTALAQLGDKGLDVVLEHLRNGNEKERRVAADALRQCAPDRLTDLLDEMLSDTDASVRFIAVAALPSGDPRLVDCLTDRDEIIRGEAAARLVQLHPERVKIFLEDDSETVRVSVLETFKRLPKRPEIDGLVNLLLEWMDKGASKLACASAEILPLIDDEASVEPLRRIALRRGTAGEVRRVAISGLAQADPRSAVETLVKIARDPVRPIRLEAVGGLAWIAVNVEGEDSQSATNVLLSALEGSLVAPPEENKEADAETEKDDATSSEGHGRHAAKEDKADQINRIRIDREGNIIEQPPEPKPEQSADGADAADEKDAADKSDETSAFPMSTLDSLQDGLLYPTEEAAEDQIALIPEDLSFLELTQGRQGKRVLSPDQRSPAHADVRALAARVVSGLRYPNIVDSLLAVLDESDEELRLAAAMSLADILETPEVLSEDAESGLARHLGDRSHILRLWLTRAASAARKVSLADALRERIQDSEPSVRAEAIVGISRVDPDFDIVPYLQDEDLNVRQSAARALVECRGADACEPLIDLAFGHDGADRIVAAQFLRDVARDQANQTVIARLQSSENLVDRRIAIEVLGELNAIRPLHAAKQNLHDAAIN